MDAVFRALADPTRRKLLDELFAEDGQTLTALEKRLPMTRFGVMKHLRVLEEANLVTTRRQGREKLHFLNPVPIRLVHDRWVSKYAEPWAVTLSGLKKSIEEEAMQKLPELKDVATDQQDLGLRAQLVIDRDTASRLGVSPLAIDATLSDAFGQRQVSTIFTQLNQYRVILEAEPGFQSEPAALDKIYVKSTTGQMVALTLGSPEFQRK